ncbi:MAG TPA: 50S ribosomal protein L11 methyltransferase [Acidobacteriota bacterium]|nr:50S ribosomal protein L11 methyltransferase [Acidobacteriota bacterium]
MWISAALATDAEHAEPLSEALLGQGALSVSVEDADAGTERETPQFGEPGSPAAPLWATSRVIALFEPGDELTERIATACREVGILEVPEIEFTEVAEENWVQLTQSQFEPIRINERLWIVPSWHSAPDPKAICLELDPGMAFGTGSHPTTRLCLEWLCTNVGSGETVLDYGCGSGILGIAAAKLGAGSVLGVDIDDNALVAARDNAARNGVQIELRHTREPLDETFDRVVANILTNPLCVMAPLLSGRVASGGRIALSGVLETQAQQVIDAYAPWLELRVGATHEGWVRLEGSRAPC